MTIRLATIQDTMQEGFPAAPPIVQCPTCRTPTPYVTTNAWRPFCSARCRSEDLGAWATERFRVAASPPDDDDDVDAAAPPAPH